MSPDVILCHSRTDAHQDHREVSMLTWNTFRDHAILEYEIPKWDGDLGQPNVYIPASKTLMERKAKLLYDHFGTQRSKDWFDAQTFMGLARLRGAECRAPDGFAEAFHATEDGGAVNRVNGYACNGDRTFGLHWNRDGSDAAAIWARSDRARQQSLRELHL